MDIIKKLAQELAIKEEQAKAAVQLIDEGNTIPFIARYRKEMTGALNDETLRNLHERLLYLRNLEEKKEQVINAITDQGKMTEDLKKKILSAETLVAVDDLYRPYRPKKQTRATKAKEKGLEPLANILLLQKTTKSMEEAILDAYNRLIAPSIERDIRSEITEKAQEGAITVFGKNLTQLLMQPPMEGRTVLGWDPAFRTGCKLAVVDPTGKVLDTVVVYPTAPQCKVEQAKKTVHDMIKKYNVSVISVGNGTACRESEQVITELIREIPEKVAYVIVNEAGASVYSASKLATEEFPEFDVGQRSAASIARRLQDPLAELVKIEPKAIGVGQYQHDMNQKRLEEALNGVVEDCVNKVGVDLNTASAPLLSYIAGISKAVAKNIVAYREENGRFHTRKELLKVPKLGPKAFLQCAGFLRIPGGEEPLDNTSVHPESYGAATKLLNDLGYTSESIRGGGLSSLNSQIKDEKELAENLGIGEMTLHDIIEELEKPGRDPRSEMPKPVLRTDVLEMKDLKEGMVLKGTVRNVIDFGAFVDIGVHQDGLVHISQMTDRYIKHPLEVVSVGDIIDVQVMSVDLNKKRIQLTMKIDHNK